MINRSMPSSKSFKLSLIQMRVNGGSRTKNLERAARLGGEAVQAGGEVLLLPEAMDLGWTDPSAKTEAGTIPDGATCSFLRELARKHRVHLCAGLTERDGDVVYN